MDKSKLMMLMRNPELMGDRDMPDVKELVEEYPFFQSARMLYVKNLRNQGYLNYGKVLRETAVFVTNRTKLFFLLDERVIMKHDAEPSQREAEEEIFDFAKLTELAGFKPELSEADKAKMELDKLISAESVRQHSAIMGIGVETGNRQQDSEQAKRGNLDRILGNAQMLERNIQAKMQKLKAEGGPNAAPDTAGEETPVVKEDTSAVLNTDLMSDTLAQIYFKSGAYENALRMYKKLCLKFPEKNSYFAARIREIEEIINNK